MYNHEESMNLLTNALNI